MEAGEPIVSVKDFGPPKGTVTVRSVHQVGKKT